jgi:RecA/RadA recombinase
MKRMLVFLLVVAFSLSFVPKGFAASDEEIQALKVQVRELMQRIEKLEGEQAQSKAEVVKTKEL